MPPTCCVRTVSLPGRLADLLERMEQGQPGSSFVVAYVSSHPVAPERLAFLRAR